MVVSTKSKSRLTDFKAHQVQKARKSKELLLGKKKSVKVGDEKGVRILEARLARRVGEKFKYPYGGAHSMVTKLNSDVRAALYLESNHSPPEASYRNSPWEHISSGDRPAHSMLFYHHRSPSGSVGGASSTGGSGVQPGWTNDNLNQHMVSGNFHLAMKQDFTDLMNTTAPNRGFYAVSLYRTALYALEKGFLRNQSEFEEVVAQLAAEMDGDGVVEAASSADVMAM